MLHQAVVGSHTTLIVRAVEIRPRVASLYRKGVKALGRLLFIGGTVVTADGSFRADVLVEDEKIVAVGTDLPANGAETVGVRAGQPSVQGRRALWREGLRTLRRAELQGGKRGG